ncbi:hypothetical protein EDB80DRAFT_693062 [Ilyonectria destructans]|nr:hypothetical protein EDB80DRAFT_693062 [Ilyonectria destructans]
MSIAVSWVRHMTIFKALLIVYCLNVVAWGGMIFLLLCTAAPAMCRPTCDDINSPRRKWIEIDSQILNALFCVPAFGLAPRRSSEAWRLLRLLPVDVGPAEVELWLRQVSSVEDVVPYPARDIPEAPPSGRRAMPTALWKLQVVIGLNLMNTVFQAILSGFMWGYSRHTRPSWPVGLFLCLAFISSMAAGVVAFIEGKAVKQIEGMAHPSMLGNEAEEQELAGRNKLPNARQRRTP